MTPLENVEAGEKAVDDLGVVVLEIFHRQYPAARDALRVQAAINDVGRGARGAEAMMGTG